MALNRTLVGECDVERKNVYFGDVERALRFIQKTESVDAKMKLVSGTKTVDAKSLLGVFSLDLSQPIMLEVYGDDLIRQQAFEELSEYLQN
ncbi:MAG: HPr family phosphocarrier protein [Eubacteriales bacterium]|nr:HPr family phosphocarrier protein [Eubacteriales bacterium]